MTLTREEQIEIERLDYAIRRWQQVWGSKLFNLWITREEMENERELRLNNILLTTKKKRALAATGILD